MESEVSVEEEISEGNASESQELRNMVQVINLHKKTCRESTIDEILNPSLIELIDQDYIFVILDPSTEAIRSIRKAYNLHPILDYECSYSSLYSIDHVFQLENCLFIGLIDIPGSQDLINPASVKILLLKGIMFIIISEQLHCIEEVFSNTMGFEIFKKAHKNDPKELIRRSTDFVRKMKRARQSALNTVDSSVGLNDLESIIYKIIHVIFIGVEEFITKMDDEVVNCIDFVSNLSTNESTDFILRINHAQKNLSLCKSYINKKAKLLPELINTKLLSKTFNEYLISMGLNMSKLEKKVKTSKKLLKSYANLYNSYVDEEIHQSSTKRSKLFQVFSAITAIFLPLNMVAAYMGMNIRVPYQVDEYDTLWPFSIILLMCLGYFVLILILFKIKSWL